jgi:ankyrin repeat protein
MSQEQDGVSPILKALYHGRRDEVDALLASGVELNIFEAAATGQTERVRELADQDPALVNAHAPDGFTPLGLAAFFGHAETVAALLAAGADVNLASRETMKMSPLGSALAVQRNDIARTLIAAGADVNAKADNDVRPLHTAAARGNLEAAALLLDHGADINAASKDGKTAFTYAEERNHPDMVQFLNSKLK